MPEARTKVQGAAMRRTMAQLVFERVWVPAGDCFTLESINFAVRLRAASATYSRRQVRKGLMESVGTEDYTSHRRRRVMSLRKVCLFAMAATLAGFAAVEALNVDIKEYEVPTPHSRPHDPALAPDGSLWYTGQAANKLGRLDPKTGEFKEYPLKIPNSGPHGLVADKDGNIWFTAISGGYVGKLEPRTGAIGEF